MLSRYPIQFHRRPPVFPEREQGYDVTLGCIAAIHGHQPAVDILRTVRADPFHSPHAPERTLHPAHPWSRAGTDPVLSGTSVYPVSRRCIHRQHPYNISGNAPLAGRLPIPLRNKCHAFPAPPPGCRRVYLADYRHKLQGNSERQSYPVPETRLIVLTAQYSNTGNPYFEKRTGCLFPLKTSGKRDILSYRINK